ncbi:cytochrome P450 [Coniochaeta ligniaria NRRL 30616]|uniref:Cytochrome P450 n=1 Tax=Coniochaeta ligniaria NRRL 30616 TaxID=1408157 RepID=A0A1J7IZX0_9PEZI|nr:cytochrome P450 [Coniochaeta ligniaria NRRL 30616]
MAILLEAAPGALLMAISIAAVAFPIVIVVNLLFRLTSNASLPPNLPWAGMESSSGPGARLKANLTSILNLKSLLNEGYAKYSKSGQAYVLPHILTGPEVVLPVSAARWLCEQPEHVMSQNEVNRQFLEADHTFFHPNIVREPIHPEVIRRELTHKLGTFAEDIAEELELCLEENWGVDTEDWKEVNLYDTMLDVISRLSMRVLVGKELTQNKEFLRSARMFDRNVVLSAAGINLLPWFLKPILSPFITAYDYMHYLTISKFILPLVKERLAQLQPSGEKQLPLFDLKKTDNYVQWAISHALSHSDPAELTPTLITKRFASLCFAAIQSSVITITNAILDVAASPHSASYLDTMRDEVLSELSSPLLPGTKRKPPASSSSPWGKAALARMVHIDSALRESMRLNGFVARGIMKTVLAPGGVTLPDGTHVPRGTKVGIQAYSVHRDGEFYSCPETYDAFRFVREAGTRPGLLVPEGRRVSASGSDTESVSETCKGDRPLALVTTSPTFLAFSHGPNACPGRFFAANQMKLTLAHIALHYEIEQLPKRPENLWFVSSMGPPFSQTIRVRRRKA